MTLDQLTIAAGIGLSLIFAYVPNVKDAFDTLGGVQKRLVMLGVLAGISAGLFGLTCASLVVPGIVLECSKNGAWNLFLTFFAAAVANQTTFALTSASHKVQTTPDGK